MLMSEGVQSGFQINRRKTDGIDVKSYYTPHIFHSVRVIMRYPLITIEYIGNDSDGIMSMAMCVRHARAHASRGIRQAAFAIHRSCGNFAAHARIARHDRSFLIILTNVTSALPNRSNPFLSRCTIRIEPIWHNPCSRTHSARTRTHVRYEPQARGLFVCAQRVVNHPRSLNERMKSRIK